MADHDAPDANQFSLTQPESAPPGRSTPERVRSDAETLGEASGGLLGAVGGMSLGIVGGPVGLVIGAIAGAVGGWWAGRGIADALTTNDDAFFREDYEASRGRRADRPYETVQAAYVAGHLAGRNPDYAGRSFEQVEADLRRGWRDEVVGQSGEWDAVRGYARTAFERARRG